MRAADALSTTNSNIEKTKLSGKAKIDNDLLQALTSDDGPMRPGALPSVQATGPGACKKLYDALGEARFKMFLVFRRFNPSMFQTVHAIG